MKYKVIPASEVKPGQPRVWCDDDSAMADDVRNGRDPGIAERMTTQPLARVKFTAAIVEDVGPRFVVKAASEMAPDEPGMRLTLSEYQKGEDHWIAYVAKLAGPERFLATRWDRPTCLELAGAIVDLHDDWHRARGVKGERYESVAVDEPKPTAPTDEEIVVAYERALQAETAGDWIRMHGGICIGSNGNYWRGQVIPIADVRAAWSRVLAAKVAASREQERRRVAVQIDDASAEDV